MTQTDAATEMAFVQSFKPGDKVPDWLVSIEPSGAGSWLGSACFVHAVTVYETKEAYYVVGNGLGWPHFHCIGDKVVLAAATKPVRFCPVVMEFWEPRR